MGVFFGFAVDASEAKVAFVGDDYGLFEKPVVVIVGIRQIKDEPVFGRFFVTPKRDGMAAVSGEAERRAVIAVDEAFNDVLKVVRLGGFVPEWIGFTEFGRVVGCVRILGTGESEVFPVAAAVSRELCAAGEGGFVKHPAVEPPVPRLFDVAAAVRPMSAYGLVDLELGNILKAVDVCGIRIPVGSSGGDIAVAILPPLKGVGSRCRPAHGIIRREIDPLPRASCRIDSDFRPVVPLGFLVHVVPAARFGNAFDKYGCRGCGESKQRKNGNEKREFESRRHESVMSEVDAAVKE